MEDVCQLGSGFWMAWSRRHRHGVVWNCEVGGGSTFSFVAVSETMNLPFKTSQQLQAQWQVLRTYLIISFYYWTPIFTFLHTLQKCFRERT
ncbi:unnamed protein product [Musa acuminata var. zebrina]